MTTTVLAQGAEQYWSVEREWEGETAFLLAGGPSLKGFKADKLRGRRVIVINNSYLLAPWASVLYFADEAWWEAHRETVYRVWSGGYWVSPAGPYENVKRLRLTGQRGLETHPNGLRHGSNSGYQAINLAYHFGVARMVLLGYDMCIVGDATHWHAGHRDGDNAGAFAGVLRNAMLPHFQSLVGPLEQAGVKIYNASIDSALTCWPYGAVEDFI